MLINATRYLIAIVPKDENPLENPNKFTKFGMDFFPNTYFKK